MKEIFANERLRKTKRYKEYQKLRNTYYKISLEKEYKQQKFFKDKDFINSSTGEFITPNYSFEKYYKKYTKSIEQKVYCIEQLAKDKGLMPVFLTLTLDGRFHPFQSVSYNEARLYTSLNSSFIFDNIETAIKAGYNHLQHIYRVLYKRIKNDVSDLMYIKVFELHKTLIPHCHILFFVKRSEIKIISKKFDKIKSEYNLDQTEVVFDENDELQEKETSYINTGVKRASKYMMKYIMKSINDDPFSVRLLDGWTRENKIRMITMSNLDLSLSDFRTIYHGMDRDTKEELLKKAKAKEVNIFYYILKNFYKFKVIEKDNKKILKEYGDIKKALVRLFIVGTHLGNGYKIDKLCFFINGNLTYEKQKYIIRRKL